jgi:hypothetical protein
MYHYLHPKVDSFGLFNKKKKPFSIAGQESNFFPPPQTQYQPLTSGYQPGGAPSGGHHQGMPDMTKSGGGANQTKEMLEALGELTFDDPTPSNLGKPGGTGGGGFKLFPNSMVDDMASSGPLNLEQQKEDWWKRYLRSIA